MAQYRNRDERVQDVATQVLNDFMAAAMGVKEKRVQSVPDDIADDVQAYIDRWTGGKGHVVPRSE